STISRPTSKYRPRNSRTSSASWASEKGVNPTRSANRTETRRRSAVGGAAGEGWSRVVPHSPQKRAPGRFVAPQVGQGEVSGWPQVSQNLRPAGLSAPQFVQVIGPL